MGNPFWAMFAECEKRGNRPGTARVLGSSGQSGGATS